MSGIYISGMEMPTTCFECPFMFARRYCCANLTLDLYQGDYEEIKGRVDGCPLVPVPAHGDLIDKQVADELNARDYEAMGSNTFTDYARGVVLSCLAAAPVIIPADPVKEEQT